MTVTCENGKLKVLLTEAEAVSYRIDELLLSHKSQNVSTALLTLFKTASKKADFSADSNRLTIEIYPIFTGGCEILFIPDKSHPKTRVPIAVKQPKQVFFVAEFLTSEQLLNTVKALYFDPCSEHIKSSLYQKNGVFRLLLYINNSAKASAKIIADQCDRILTSRISFAITKEYWHEICRDTAVKQLGEAFFKRY